MNVAVKVSSDVTYLFITLIGKFEFKKQMGQIFNSVYIPLCAMKTSLNHVNTTLIRSTLSPGTLYLHTTITFTNRIFRNTDQRKLVESE